MSVCVIPVRGPIHYFPFPLPWVRVRHICGAGDRSERARLLGAEAPPEDHRGGAARCGVRGGLEGHGALGGRARQEGMYIPV